MLMTAKTAVDNHPCPLGRQFDDPHTGAWCRGPICPAWRWFEAAVERRQRVIACDANTPSPGDGWTPISRSPDGMNNIVVWERPVAHRRGYCGAFGKVEHP